MIQRRTLLFTAIGVSACARRKSGETPAFPRYASDWTLASGPEPVESVSGAQAAWTARYNGKPPMRVTVYRMSSQTSAFAQVQGWRAEPNKLAFYKGEYFGIAEGEGADHDHLNRFAAAVQGGFP